MQILFFHLNYFSIFIKVLGFKILLLLFVFVLWTLIETVDLSKCLLTQLSFAITLGSWSSPQKFPIIFRGSIWHQPVRLGEVTKMAPRGYCNYGNWDMRWCWPAINSTRWVSYYMPVSHYIFWFLSLCFYLGWRCPSGELSHLELFLPNHVENSGLRWLGPPGTTPLWPLWLGIYSIRPENVEMHMILGSNQGPITTVLLLQSYILTVLTSHSYALSMGL